VEKLEAFKSKPWAKLRIPTQKQPREVKTASGHSWKRDQTRGQLAHILKQLGDSAIMAPYMEMTQGIQPEQTASDTWRKTDTKGGRRRL